MNHRLTTKSLLFLVGLFVVFNGYGQSSLIPYKITVFEDAAQIGWKGIVRFHQQRAEVPLSLDVNAAGMDLIPGTGDVRISSFRVRQDTVMSQSMVMDWSDVLRANISRTVTILYVIGNEYDEVSGTVRLVNDEGGMLLLHGNDGSEYFIPLDQIKQVIVQSISDYKVDRKTVQDVLEINLDKDVPFVPMEMFSVDAGIQWTPVCRIRILGSDKARLQMVAHIQNKSSTLKDVEVELAAGKLMTEGQLDAQVTDAGKMSMQPGDEVVVNYRETELAYESVYRSFIPWDIDQADGDMHNFTVDHTLQFELAGSKDQVCKTYTVIDENNRNVANLAFTPSVEKGKVALNLGPEKQMRVSVVEKQKVSGRKPEKVGDRLYDRVSVEGKIVCYNVGRKFMQLNLDREIFGEVVESGKARVQKSPQGEGKKVMRWRLSLDKGQKKEVVYRYDALVPH